MSFINKVELKYALKKIIAGNVIEFKIKKMNREEAIELLLANVKKMTNSKLREEISEYYEDDDQFLDAWSRSKLVDTYEEIYQEQLEGMDDEEIVKAVKNELGQKIQITEK